jgi:hypothetical protein
MASAQAIRQGYLSGKISIHSKQNLSLITETTWTAAPTKEQVNVGQQLILTTLGSPDNS